MGVRTRGDRQYAEWLVVVAELLAMPGAATFPRDPLAVELSHTFGCQVSWNWRDADGRFGFDLLDPVPGFPTPEHAEFWTRNGLGWHPLLRWFAHSGDPRPMTVGRVPRSVVPDQCFGVLTEQLAPYGFEQQLSIPYRLEGAFHRAYVLARGGEDFSDEDVELSRRLQPLLELLERQRAVLRSQANPGEHLDLTGRELSVLALLAEGRTAVAMASRLGISPRTVHKHLENLYRKLGVRDRLEAVLVASRAGVLRTGGSDPGEHARPGEQLTRQVVHLGGGDGVDLLEQLVDREQAPLEQLRLPQPRHP